MTEESQVPSNGSESPESAVPEDRTEFVLDYEGASQVLSEEGATRVALFGNTRRPPVKAEGRIRDPLLIREALSALYDVVKSDFRYVPKDRTAYLAYQQMRKQTAGAGAWKAQREYFDWLQRNDPLAWLLLDPVISVHPDEVFFEVFSKDEGTYAKLGIDWSAFELSGERQYGTTNIDYSQALFEGIQRMRSYRETRFSIGSEAVRLATEGEAEVLEKKIRVPDTWVRGFLQVQSAATLEKTGFRLAPIDLYNVLRHLRLNADQKKGGRAIRVELLPGEAPRLVLEPWEEVFETSGGPYRGRRPHLVRIWGRRRLMLLRRLLPFTESVDVHLLGSGLPSFYVLRAGPVHFTMGLTGFTASNWSRALSLDVLMPRPSRATPGLDRVLEYLAEHWQAPRKQMQEALQIPARDLLEALQLGCQHGKLIYDIAREVYRLRPLTAEPLDLERLEFRNARERVAMDLLVRKNAVRLVTENHIFGVGTELTGYVEVEADGRDYRPQMLLGEDGRAFRAECTCTFHRKHGLKEGPCEHIMALRILVAREQVKRREGRKEDRQAITVETRTYSKRETAGERIVQLALDRRRIKSRWGRRGGRLRQQSLGFNSVAAAREAYFTRVGVEKCGEGVGDGVVDQHRRLTHGVANFRERVGKRVEIADVARERAGSLDLGFQVFQPLGFAGEHGDPVAAGGEAARDCRAGRVADTGDHRDGQVRAHAASFAP